MLYVCRRVSVFLKSCLIKDMHFGSNDIWRGRLLIQTNRCACMCVLRYMIGHFNMTQKRKNYQQVEAKGT